MSVQVIIPYRSIDRYRDAAKRRVAPFYSQFYGRPIYGEDSGPEFNRGRAINNAAERAVGDVFIFADADILPSFHALQKGVKLVREGAAMVVPFNRLRCRGNPYGEEVIKQDYTGGINILSRKTFETVGGFDPRFKGWGCEDVAFAAAVGKLVGPVVWLDYEAVHFWHPKSDPDSNPHRAEGLELLRRYQEAQTPEEVLEIVREHK